jgi:hypothetical protein
MILAGLNNPHVFNPGLDVIRFQPIDGEKSGCLVIKKTLQVHGRALLVMIRSC